ncbi:hypothetical protein [Gaoshiqia sp. Z1-71]|uniref:hypothetical protein n=1 Tax=Gaoshiqia hydrogeniformans TaxID=3290090 RepID=UPI003BF7C013
MSVIVILKLLHVYLLATVKYFLTFPYALLIGLKYSQALIAVTVGGITGFVFFYYLSGALINFYQKHRETVYRILKRYTRIDLFALQEKKKSRETPVFSKRLRRFVKLRTKYGMWGIIVTTPILLSIPVGAFLLNKYYAGRKNVFAYMVISILGWAVIFSAFVVIFPKPI